MASIERWKGDRWRAHWRGPDGRSQSKVFERKLDAQRFLTSVEASKLTGQYVDPAAGKVTFRAFAEQWRAIQPHRPSTELKVRQHLELHVYPHLGSRALADIRTSHVQAMVTTLGQTLAPASVEGIYRTVASIFTAAVADRIIATSPCRRIARPRASTGRVDPLTVNEVAALIESAPDRYRALLVLLAGCGLRIGEALGLTVDRVDFLRRSVNVDRQLVLVPGAPPTFGPPKTESSVRTVPMPQVVVDELAAHLARYSPGPDGLVFTNRDGRSIRSNAWSMQWQRIAKAAGVDATTHELRHFYTSALIAAGSSVKSVQANLGHASAKVTLDVYGHLWPDSDDRTRAAIDGLLGAAVAPALHGPEGEPSEPLESVLSVAK